MALLNPEQQCLVLRAIYDGPAYAGKTTNLSALATSLGSEMYSGEEADGRTLYFDWVDYIGGRFDGMPIHCQIVGVPGQRILQSRRRLLLDTADVVIFVADSQPEQLAENVHSFQVLRETLSSKEPAVGIVVQANKRDAEGAIELEALQSALGNETPLAMTEAIAEHGEGVRETFILAVRLALDRVRELQSRNALRSLEPEINDGPQLLTALLETENHELEGLSALDSRETSQRPTSNTETPDTETPDTETPDTETSDTETSDSATANPQASSAQRMAGPPFPNASVPPGFVWPPVTGRVVLHEAVRNASNLERNPRGDWMSSCPGWKLSAPLEGLFFDFATARKALLDWARWHAAAGSRLSPSRCIVLMPESDTVWRLWQIVRQLPNLHDTVRELFAQPDDVLLGEGLLRVINLRLQAEREFVASGWIDQLDLASVGASDNDALLFTDFSPYPVGSPNLVGPPKTTAQTATDEAQWLRQELGPLLRSELELAPRRLPTMLASLQKAAAANHRDSVAESVQQILLGS